MSSSAFTLNSFDRYWASRCPSVNLGFPSHDISTTAAKLTSPKQERPLRPRLGKATPRHQATAHSSLIMIMDAGWINTKNAGAGFEKAFALIGLPIAKGTGPE